MTTLVSFDNTCAWSHVTDSFQIKTLSVHFMQNVNSSNVSVMLRTLPIFLYSPMTAGVERNGGIDWNGGGMISWIFLIGFHGHLETVEMEN